MTTPPSDKHRELDADEQHVAALLQEHFTEVDDDPCFSCDLEGFVAGRLGAAARREVEAHLAGCATCREALPVVRQLHDEGALEMPPFDPDAPPAVNGHVVRLDDARRPTSKAAPRHRLWAVMAAAAAVLAVAVAVPLATSGPDRLIPKGDGALGSTEEPPATEYVALGVLRDGVTFRAASGDELRAGDLVRFFYTADAAGYLAVFHLAEDGETAVLFPRESSVSAPIAAGDDLALDAGATITAGDSCEWVIAVFSDEPLGLASAADAIKGSAVLEPSSCAAVVRVPTARSVSIFAVRQ